MYIRLIELSNTGTILVDQNWPITGAGMIGLRYALAVYRNVYRKHFNPLDWFKIVQLTIALKRYRIAPNIYLEYRW
jgi:hypothetical protein